MKNNVNQEKKRGSVWKKVLVVVFFILILLIMAAYGIFRYYYSLLSQFSDANVSSMEVSVAEEEVIEETEETEPDDLEGEELSEEEIEAVDDSLRKNLEEMQKNSDLYTTDAFNILLIGVDTREEGFSGRSDSMILISMNKKTKQIIMTSLLRDIYVSVPGYGNNRLNAAYAYGGTALLTDTIKQNFGISVDRCVVVNFHSVANAIDSVGGVDIDLTAEEIDLINENIKWQYKVLGMEFHDEYVKEGEGERHLNGAQALYYARIRKIGTDFARTNRQRVVLASCLGKIQQLSLNELNELLHKFLPQVQTNLTEGDFAVLLLMALDIAQYNTQTMTIPIDGTWSNARIRGMAVLTIDFAANSDAWSKLVNNAE